MPEDREKWRKYEVGVASRRAKNRTEQVATGQRDNMPFFFFFGTDYMDSPDFYCYF